MQFARRFAADQSRRLRDSGKDGLVPSACPFAALCHRRGGRVQSRMSTAAEVAAWLAREVRAASKLSQKDAAVAIEDTFGSRHVYHNPKGALAISKAVLAEFRQLPAPDVLWVGGRRFWRLREAADAPGRTTTARHR